MIVSAAEEYSGHNLDIGTKHSKNWDDDPTAFSVLTCATCGRPVLDEGFSFDRQVYCSSHCAHTQGVYVLFNNLG